MKTLSVKTFSVIKSSKKTLTQRLEANHRNQITGSPSAHLGGIMSPCPQRHFGPRGALRDREEEAVLRSRAEGEGS